jgi:hypothetical protein
VVGCNRSELRDKLQDIFPRKIELCKQRTSANLDFIGIPGLGSNDWLLPTKNEMALEIRPIYQNPVLEIQDIEINHLLGKTESRRYDAVLAFVRQFYDINTKWDNCYEPLTMEIINQGIRVQECIMRRLRPSQYTRNPEPLNDENLLIASALRVMALGHRIMDVCGYLPNYSLKRFEETMFLEEETVPESYVEPSYKISVFHTFAADPGGVDLSCMLQYIVETAQRMMLRQRPEDWPVIFHVLCILKLTSWKLDIDIHYICSFKGVKNLDETWDSLCRLYLASTRGCDPLVNDWDSGRYETLVGKGDYCVSWFEALSKLWVEGGTYFDRVVWSSRGADTRFRFRSTESPSGFQPED